MDEIGRRYIELLKGSLVNDLYIENEARLVRAFHWLAKGARFDHETIYGAPADPSLMELLRTCKARGSRIGMPQPSGAPDMRNFLELAHTMVGRARLDNIEHCVEAVVTDRIPGDLIETGVWRGGACIFMRGLLAAHGITDRVVWAADSFEGVPPPTYAQDRDLDLSAMVLPVLAVPLEEVQELFRRYGLLDDQVRFLKGWFRDTLPLAPIKELALLRLDGDLYESTMDALWPLYPLLAPGGFVIVDDYYSCPPCGKAIDEFRDANGIVEPMERIDAQSVFWRKT